MVRIALIADCHVANHKRWGGAVSGGVNQRGWECVEVLRAASISAKQRGCQALFVLGDLFDHTRPSPPLVAATIKALKAGKLPVEVILGNHDRQSMHDLDQACASMAEVDGISIHSQPTVMRYGPLEVGVIPYSDGEAKDWLASGMSHIAPYFTPTVDERAVLTHLGIWDDDTPPYLKAAKDAVGIGHVRWLCDAHRVTFFAAGNWHEMQMWRPRPGTTDPQVLIPGTVCPHNFSDPQDHGCVAIYDSESAAWQSISLPTPLFLSRDMEDAGKTVTLDELRHHYESSTPTRPGPRAYVRLTVKTEQIEWAGQWRSDILKRWPQTIIHVEAEASEAEAFVHEAARQAVAAGEGVQSLIDFAELGEVEDPGTMDGVIKRLEAYRKAAG